MLATEVLLVTCKSAPLALILLMAMVMRLAETVPDVVCVTTLRVSAHASLVSMEPSASTRLPFSKLTIIAAVFNYLFC